jgi:endonuclease/exonuclease/phosphatase (EEP) superfamily protein YafD
LLKQLVKAFLLAALAGACAYTAVASFDGLARVANILANFRLHAAAGCVVLAIVLVVAHLRIAAVVATLAAAVNVAPALAYATARSTPALSSAADGPRKALRVMTVNTLYRADNIDTIAASIRTEQPDVVLLQELIRDKMSLLHRLRTEYPWQVHCGPTWQCDVAVISRVPWLEAQAGLFGAGRTKMAWARFGDQLGGAAVASVHVRWPTVTDQALELRSAYEAIAAPGRPVVIAGDLNAVPWTHPVRALGRDGALRPAGGYLPTWPNRTPGSGRKCLACIPQLQIDQVLVGPQVEVLATRRSADIGSDHLPLVTDLMLPAIQTVGAAP